jgi:hypothetical protein
MFIAYALHVDGPEFDQEVECADLDEALTHLRELITSELAARAPIENGPHFDHYGVRISEA